VFERLRIFAGNSNRSLAEEICTHLGVELGRAQVGRFSDEEIRVEIEESVRGMDVFVIQSTCHPVNTNLMELLIMLDALRRASAGRITAVIPYYGYARQDRKVEPRAPITAKLVANLISVAGADRVLAVDLHAGQIQGFFDIPVDHLFATPVLLPHLRHRYHQDELTIVSPDPGGLERARAFAKRLGAPLAVIDKRREGPNISTVFHVIGEVEGRRMVIVDDMIDTAGTVANAAQALLERGAREVIACCTHPVLSGPALERVNASELRELVVTNTIPLREEARKCPKIVSLSIAPPLSEAVRRIHLGQSVSELFV